MRYPISNINEQTPDPRYVDSQLEMCSASAWKAKDGHYRQYHAREARYGRSEAGRYDNTHFIWTNVKVRSGDFCRRRYSRSSDNRWNLLVFECYTTGSKEDYAIVRYAIEMFQSWAAADFQQAGGGMATFLGDDYPYLEGERTGSFVRKQWGANNPESSYEGSIGSLSIFEFLKMASFADVFNAVHGEVVPGRRGHKSVENYFHLPENSVIL